MADNKVPGAKATPEQQDALLTAAMNGEIPNGASFFEKFRQLVLTGYFTSEIGMAQEREYLPVPGEYHGDYLYRSEEHTSELQSLMRISYAVFCLKKKTLNLTYLQ